MTNNIDFFDPAASVTMPTSLVGLISHAHEVRRTALSRLHRLDKPFAAIDGAILCCRHRRQFTVKPDRAATIGSPYTAGAQINRP